MFTTESVKVPLVRAVANRASTPAKSTRRTRSMSLRIGSFGAVCGSPQTLWPRRASSCGGLPTILAGPRLAGRLIRRSRSNVWRE